MQNFINKISTLYKKSEAILSNVKFAVTIITLFAIFLTIGTFLESYHGTLYANKTVYKAWWFMATQLLMFLSIIMATVVRLPMKKHLYGFYTIHLGLIILFVGSFFTYIVGIDGTIQLLPNKPANRILINEDIIEVRTLESNKAARFFLPYVASPRSINKVIAPRIEILEYLPSIEKKLSWTKLEEGKNHQSAQYLIFNDNVSQKITLSLEPSSDYTSSKKLGPLTVHLMPKELLECFMQNTPSQFVIWYTSEGRCSTPEEEKIDVLETNKGSKFILVKSGDEILKFLPDFTPLPVTEELNKKTDSPIRVLSLSLFTKKPHLFTFGDDIVYYKKREKRWIKKSFSTESMITLPWMGFKLDKIKSSDTHYPLDMPYFVKPIQDNNEIIQGAEQAAKIKVGNQTHWLTTQNPLQLASDRGGIFIQFAKKKIDLPYQLTLSQFVMKKNPGTNDPASFESFVELLDGRTKEGIKKFHVYMNEPLKYDDFTFYQSSYFPVGQNQQGQDEFGSVLSVNYDPGRKFKYLGSLLLVLGSMWHFYLRRRKRKINA